jgi:hypothetical protein
MAMLLFTGLAAAGIVAAVAWLRAPLAKPAPISLARAAMAPIPAIQPDPDAAMRVYRGSVVPLLDEFDRQNALALRRSMRALHDRVALRRTGVVPFAQDVRSWGTRFGVMRRYPSDLWARLRRRPQDSSEVTAYVNDKFRRHVLSEQKLQQDIAGILLGFEEDLAANRNRLYSQMSLPLAQIRCEQPLAGPAFEQFRRDVERRGVEMSRQMAPDTVVAGIAEFSSAWLATDVTQAVASRLVVQIIARLGASMAVEGVAAGGATVGGGAAGGGAGSFAGPAGTVIGIGVGIVVGAAVDWWLSDKFEEKIVDQSNLFLDTLETRLREGNGKSPGLRQTLTEAIKVAGQLQRKAVEQAMQEIKPR